MDGRTLRKKSKYAHHVESGTIKACNRHIERYDNGFIEAAVTAVDEYFDDDFLIGRGISNINHQQRWDTVVETMEQEYAVKEFRFNRHEFRWEILYQLPITAHRNFGRTSSDLIPRSKIAGETSNPKSQYLFWRGELFDTEFVYGFDGEKLKQLFPLVMPEPVFSNEIKKVRHFTVRDSRGKRYRSQAIDINHTRRRTYGSWASAQPDQFIEIDLGEYKLLTHIGTAGSFPSLDLFPKRSIVGRRRMRLFRMANDGYASHVFVVREDFVESWCTEYELQYRHFSSNEWLSLGNFTANWNARSEHINELFHFFNKPGGLYTRHLRIRPVDWHNQVALQVALYERRLDDPPTTSENPAQTVDYVLACADHMKDCLDGQKRFYGCRSWRKHDSYYQHRDRKGRGKSMRDQIEEGVREHSQFH